MQSSGKREVTGANVLVAIFSEQESQAVFFLRQQDIARIDVVNYITHGISKASDQEGDDEQSRERQEEEGGEESGSALNNFATNLNAEAQAGRIDALACSLQSLEGCATV